MSKVRPVGAADGGKRSQAKVKFGALSAPVRKEDCKYVKYRTRKRSQINDTHKRYAEFRK